ncbi:mechanosensitive ion channel family protein [Aegicerativicinus sediminis]|uniref:mechanosensitive ion channel family protein n=1 Tax=Aegicerativicinus sediminis TaxID=2893202 RepID=UPI001E3596EF|nr:mechanosensitive ion channel domain-containing protein [Aegicerativicinus sediminis]
MKRFKEFLDYSISVTQDVEITVRAVLILCVVLIFTAVLLRLLRRILTRNLPFDDKKKFDAVFSFGRWVVYLIIMLITFHTLGVNVTGIFAASAALLIGIGLALQTLFQDIIAGIFILIDQTVHVGDIIELEGRIGKVEEIKLRSTRTITIDNKVLVIPNHLYLTNSLYNWTQNGTTVRDSVSVGVAYGSDIHLVKDLLTQAATEHPEVLSDPPVTVVFKDFGESSLDFKVVFTLNDGFRAQFVQSEIRFRIDELFREHKVTIPFPQRDIHLFQPKPNSDSSI